MKRLTLTLVLLILSGLASSSLYAEEVTPNMVDKWPSSRYTVNADGTVTDKTTGLVWQRCAEGLSGADCSSGTAKTYTWAEALGVPATVNAEALVGDLTRWRLPSIKELESVVAFNRMDAPPINSQIFPGTLLLDFWTSTASITVNDRAWAVAFEGTGDGVGGVKRSRDSEFPVRLVRGADAVIVIEKINDTGVAFGREALGGNNAGCTGVAISAQDCSHGRDAQAAENILNKVGSGAAGFDFTKLDSNGEILTIQNQSWDDNGSEAAGTKWSCVEDNVTGLVWEVKTNDDTLHDKDYTYSWYNTDPRTNGGGNGVYNDPKSRACTGYVAGDPETYCNTQAYVARVNEAGLCGATDWRLPDLDALRSIVHYGATGAILIDLDFFPNDAGVRAFWSSSPFSWNPSAAWVFAFAFRNNHAYGGGRSDNYLVRLVRGGQ